MYKQELVKKTGTAADLGSKLYLAGSLLLTTCITISNSALIQATNESLVMIIKAHTARKSKGTWHKSGPDNFINLY